MTGSSTQQSVSVRDVTLRDGLQLTGGLMSVPAKLSLLRRLRALGVTDIEVGSMARPDLVPALSNTLELVAALTEDELANAWVWVATPGHVRRAVEAGVRHLQYCLSVSDAHNRANVGRDSQTSMAGVPEALDLAQASGADVQLCLATSFTCPFEGPIATDRVLELATDERAAGCTDVVICDTLGQADPGEVFRLVSEVHHEVPDKRVVFHGHDTWGLGVANTLAAIEGGAGMVDAAIGALGGCPFAPGASGNTATEDILFALKPDWLTTEMFGDLVRLGEEVTHDLGEENRSRASRGARSRAKAFPWVLGA